MACPFKNLLLTLDELSGSPTPSGTRQRRKSTRSCKKASRITTALSDATTVDRYNRETHLSGPRPHRITLDSDSLYESSHLYGVSQYRQISKSSQLGEMADPCSYWLPSDYIASVKKHENKSPLSCCVNEADWLFGRDVPTAPVDESRDVYTNTSDDPSKGLISCHWPVDTFAAQSVSTSLSVATNDISGHQSQLSTSPSPTKVIGNSEKLYFNDTERIAAAPPELPRAAVTRPEISPRVLRASANIQQWLIDMTCQMKNERRRVLNETTQSIAQQILTDEEPTSPKEQKLNPAKVKLQQHIIDAECQLNQFFEDLTNGIKQLREREIAEAAEAHRRIVERDRQLAAEAAARRKAEEERRKEEVKVESMRLQREENERRRQAEAQTAAAAARLLAVEEEKRKKEAEEEKIKQSSPPTSCGIAVNTLLQVDTLPAHIVKSRDLAKCVKDGKTEYDAIRMSNDREIENFRKTILPHLKKPLNQAGATQAALQRACDSVSEAFKSCQNKSLQLSPVGPPLRPAAALDFAFYSLSYNMIQDCDIDKQITRQPKSVWVYATIAATITRTFPKFGQIFSGILYDQCCYTIPYYHPKPKTMTFKDFCILRGGREGEGEEDFFPRMASTVRLYLAFLVCSNEDDAIWRWFARVLQIPARRCTLFIIVAALESMAFYAWQIFGVQLFKILIYIQKYMLPTLHTLKEKAVGSVKERMKDALAKLEVSLQECFANKTISVPDGFEIKETITPLSENI